MSSSSDHEREEQRLKALLSYAALDRDGGEAIDALVRLSAYICRTPIALVGLVDDRREWLLSVVGFPGREILRTETMCTFVLDRREPLVVENARIDPRFRDHPLVLPETGVRFYAGVPLINRDGFALGALCVADRMPRTLDAEQLTALRDLSTGVMQLLEARRVDVERKHALEIVQTLSREREGAHLRTERRNELLQLTEEVGEIGHWHIDLASNEVIWSPQVYRIHGLDPVSFPGVDVATGVDRYHPDDRARVSAAIARAAEDHQPFDFDLRIVRPDGTMRRVHSRGRVEVDPKSKKARAIFGVFQDVTEREAVRERIERRDRLVTTGTLAAGVGHEINNPLTYVSANLDYALDELRSIAVGARDANDRLSVIPKHVRHIADVLVEAREGADRIRKIVRGLGTFAREETPVVPTDVHATIETSLNMAMHELRHRVTLVKELLPVHLVLADEASLAQVFVNLLINAAQAFPAKEAVDVQMNKVVVSTHLSADDQVVIEVTDNGSGMSPDVAARVFDPFFTTKPVGEGTGLGLSICHSVITEIGGEISCTSVLGKGTTFRVVLPAARDAYGTLRGISSAPVPASRGRLLLVDDEETVLRAMSRVLSAEHEVVALADPREAARRLIDEGEAFDAVFCDVMMPNLSGMELYRRVAEKRPILAERFVFVTAGGATEEAFDFLAETRNERLDKPFENQRLRDVARRMVALARQEPRIRQVSS